MEDQSVHNLLAELRAQGVEDSAGFFTIDPEKARRKLREFGSREPHHYVCLLVSGLIAGGARWIEIETTPKGLQLCSDFVCQANELEQLYALATTESTHHFFKLALGLEASLATPREIRLEVWGGHDGSVLRLTESHFELASLQSCPWGDDRVRTRIRLRKSLSLQTAAKLLKLVRSEPEPEQILLRERCAWAPIPILVNRDSITTSPEWGPHAVTIKLSEPSTRASRFETEIAPSLVLPCEGYEAHIGLDPKPCSGALAQLVVSGIALQGWPLKLANRVLIYSDRVRTDLSMTAPVQDLEYERLKGEIEEAIGAGLRALYAEQLAREPHFQGSEGPLCYQQLGESYERYGFLTVVKNGYDGPRYQDAPLVNYHRFLERLFPKHVYDQEIGHLLPPGDYAVRYRSRQGPWLAVLQGCEAPPTRWADERYALHRRLQSKEPNYPLPHGVVHSGPRPSVESVIQLFHKAHLEHQLSAKAVLDYLCFLQAASLRPLPHFQELLQQLQLFSVPENLVNDVIEACELTTDGGRDASLRKLLEGTYQGSCYQRYTDQPLHFESLRPDTVVLDETDYSNLLLLVGFRRMKRHQGRRSGLINRAGQWVSEPVTVTRGPSLSEGRLAVRVHDLWGYTDASGEPVIALRFQSAGRFEEGHAVVSLPDQSYRLLNFEGQLVGPVCQFIGDRRDGLRLAQQQQLWGFLDDRAEWILPPQFASLGHFGPGRAVVETAQGRYQIDLNGERLGDIVEVDAIGPLTQGLAPARSAGLWGFIGPQGDWVLKPRYERVLAPQPEALVVLQPGRGWGLLARTGEALSEFEFEGVGPGFGEGLLGVKKEGLWTFLDSRGERVLGEYLDAGAFSQGVAAVCQDDGNGPHWGYINRSGTSVIPPRFRFAGPFSEGRAVAEPTL